MSFEKNKKVIYQALNNVKDPELMIPITKLGMVKKISINHITQSIDIDISLTRLNCPLKDKIYNDIKKEILKLKIYKLVKIFFSSMTIDEVSKLKSRFNRIKANVKTFGFNINKTKIFAIASGKGGVGKSTIISNLACILVKQGLKVALIDADIYGFCIPDLMGYNKNISLKKVNNMILPPVNHGVKIMSIGMFLKTDKPILWRGPMLHRTLEQFIKNVYFGSIDVMLIDLPPGTGDIAISLSQIIPDTKIIIITTPQKICTKVAERAGHMCISTGQNIVGIIENMSFIKEKSKFNIFGSGGGDRISNNLSSLLKKDIPLLARIPFNINIRKHSDLGKPYVLTNKIDYINNIFLKISKKMIKIKH